MQRNPSHYWLFQVSYSFVQLLMIDILITLSSKENRLFGPKIAENAASTALKRDVTPHSCEAHMLTNSTHPYLRMLFPRFQTRFVRV
jgi:hypothetical protein